MANNLYTTQADEFSKTRTAPWDGWQTLIKNPDFKIKDSLRILDLGCGNARFLKFIQNHKEITQYLGIDNSELLIEQAKEIGGEYQNMDLNTVKWNIEGKFDLVIAFGLQHHLDSFEIRLHLLQQMANNLDQHGIATITYWQFLNYPRYENKIRKLEGENNYIMSFGSNQNARFCHYTNLQEIENIEKDSGLKLLANYRSDGKDGTENIYRVYQKS